MSSFDPQASHIWRAKAEAQISATADEVASTLRVAHALAAGGRRLDLTGLDLEIGQLCAGLLDLPPELGRKLRPRLVELVGELDRLSGVFVPP